MGEGLGCFKALWGLGASVDGLMGVCYLVFRVWMGCILAEYAVGDCVLKV